MIEILHLQFSRPDLLRKGLKCDKSLYHQGLAIMLRELARSTSPETLLRSWLERQAFADQSAQQFDKVLLSHAIGLFFLNKGEYPEGLKWLQQANIEIDFLSDDLAKSALLQDQISALLMAEDYKSALDLSQELEKMFEGSDQPLEQAQIMFKTAIICGFLGQRDMAFIKVRSGRMLFEACSYITRQANDELDFLAGTCEAYLEYLDNHILKSISQIDTFFGGNFCQNNLNTENQCSNLISLSMGILQYSCYLQIMDFPSLTEHTQKLQQILSNWEGPSFAILSKLLVSIQRIVISDQVFDQAQIIQMSEKILESHLVGYFNLLIRPLIMTLNKKGYDATHLSEFYEKNLKRISEKCPADLRDSFFKNYSTNSKGNEDNASPYLLHRIIDMTRDLMIVQDPSLLAKKVLSLYLDLTELQAGALYLFYDEKTCECLATINDIQNTKIDNIDIMKTSQILKRKSRPIQHEGFFLTPCFAEGKLWSILVAKNEKNQTINRDLIQNLSHSVGFAFRNSCAMVKTRLDLQEAKRKIAEQNERISEKFSIDKLVTISSSMKNLVSMIHRVADKNVPVLLTGESGVGKEMIAHIIHRMSLRHENHFVAINCGAIPENLIESELFGYEAGAFTDALERRDGLFVQADNGTLFLDEIGELPLQMQAKLLRALADGEILPIGARLPTHVNTRIICATNRDLKKMIAEGKFREDLYYRIHVFNLEIPSLRERKEDIPDLIHEALRQFAHENGITKTISSDTMPFLIEYNWPGNVRELKNVLSHLCLSSEGSEITKKDLSKFGFDQLNKNIEKPSSMSTTIPDVITEKIHRGTLSLSEAKEEFEKLQIERALQICNGKITAASTYLKMPRPQVSRLIKKYGLKKGHAEL